MSVKNHATIFHNCLIQPRSTLARVSGLESLPLEFMVRLTGLIFEFILSVRLSVKLELNNGHLKQVVVRAPQSWHMIAQAIFRLEWNAMV